MTMKKYTGKVWKRVTCPRCGTEYEVPLEEGQKELRSVFSCHSTTNEAMKRYHKQANGEVYEWVYCGQVIAFDISRGRTQVAAVPAWAAQPNRLRREKVAQPTARDA